MMMRRTMETIRSAPSNLSTITTSQLAMYYIHILSSYYEEPSSLQCLLHEQCRHKLFHGTRNATHACNVYFQVCMEQP